MCASIDAEAGRTPISKKKKNCVDPMLFVATAGHRLWDISFWRSFGLDEISAWDAL
jgi:hypothetical protein